MSINIDRVYTRGGDKGQTSLSRGPRVSKTHPRIESYGTLDELLVCIGRLRTYLQTTDFPAPKDTLAFGQDLIQQLLYIQQRVFDLGAILANPEPPAIALRPNENDIASIEKTMDEWSALLPPLTSFVLPGGNIGNVYAHECRVVARRAERTMVHLLESITDSVPSVCMQYINRLSDYFFVLSRLLSLRAGDHEVLWEAGK